MLSHRDLTNNKTNSRGEQKSGEPIFSPVFKFRQLIVAVFCVGLLILIPMFMVWKQVYITNVSRRESVLSDSLSVLSKEIVALRLYNEHLSSTQRIESIARLNIGLDYPASQQIVVVRENGSAFANSNKPSGFLSLFLKPFTHERG